MDNRIKKLSNVLVNYSTNIQDGEKVLIEFEGEECLPLIRQIIKDIYKAGGMPYVNIYNSSITRELLLEANEEQLQFLMETRLHQMKGMDAYISVKGGYNTAELADISSKQLNLYNRILNPVLDYRVSKTKWVILRYPNNSMAQLANTSLEAFEDFYFDVCCLDYSKMEKAMDSLCDLLSKTDKVRIKGVGTDLTFSIKGIPNVKCFGLRNIPDGEVYTAPVRESINGVISYNTPSNYQGFTFENITFEFKDGKIVKATANNTEKINQILDSDEGARYIGEFAIGVNPYVLKPMKDTLFDEKIAGSIHLTPGQAYKQANNGNKSSVHWDLVLIQREEWGGGEIWFDDKLVRKDGIFVLDELKGLNPENLK